MTAAGNCAPHLSVMHEISVVDEALVVGPNATLPSSSENRQRYAIRTSRPRTLVNSITSPPLAPYRSVASMTAHSVRKANRTSDAGRTASRLVLKTRRRVGRPRAAAAWLTPHSGVTHSTPRIDAGTVGTDSMTMSPSRLVNRQ